MDDIETLIKARKLISDPKVWTQNIFIDPKGCMCSVGAILKANDPTVSYKNLPDDDVMAEALVWADKHFDYPSQHQQVMRFNDDYQTTHKDVMKMFDRSIWKAEQNTFKKFIRYITIKFSDVTTKLKGMTQ